MYIAVYNGRSEEASWDLKDGETIIGLASEAQIDLSEFDEKKLVAPRHAILRIRGTQASVEDLGAPAGTYFVGLERLETGKRYPLDAYDEFLIAGIKLIIFNDRSQGW